MSGYRKKRRYQSEADWLKWSLISLAVGAVLFISWRAFVMHQVTQMFQGIADNAQATSQRVIQQEKNRQANLARERDLKAQQDAQALALQHQLHQETLARQARKNAAWEQFFKPSPQCRNDPINVECANKHIRAKSRFEATYQDTL